MFKEFLLFFGSHIVEFGLMVLLVIVCILLDGM